MAEFIYMLSTLTSFACAALLLRAYLRSRVRLLFWSTLAFTGLALNNLLLWIDIRVVPADVNLSVWRVVPAVLGLCVLCYGMIWESA